MTDAQYSGLTALLQFLGVAGVIGIGLVAGLLMVLLYLIARQHGRFLSIVLTVALLLAGARSARADQGCTCWGVFPEYVHATFTNDSGSGVQPGVEERYGARTSDNGDLGLHSPMQWNTLIQMDGPDCQGSPSGGAMLVGVIDPDNSAWVHWLLTNDFGSSHSCDVSRCQAESDVNHPFRAFGLPLASDFLCADDACNEVVAELDFGATCGDASGTVAGDCNPSTQPTTNPCTGPNCGGHVPTTGPTKGGDPNAPQCKGVTCAPICFEFSDGVRETITYFCGDKTDSADDGSAWITYLGDPTTGTGSGFSLTYLGNQWTSQGDQCPPDVMQAWSGGGAIHLVAVGSCPSPTSQPTTQPGLPTPPVATDCFASDFNAFDSNLLQKFTDAGFNVSGLNGTLSGALPNISLSLPFYGSAITYNWNWASLGGDELRSLEASIEATWQPIIRGVIEALLAVEAMFMLIDAWA